MYVHVLTTVRCQILHFPAIKTGWLWKHNAAHEVANLSTKLYYCLSLHVVMCWTPGLIRCEGSPGYGCLVAMGHLAACDLGGGVEGCGMHPHQLEVSVVQCQLATGRTVCTNLARFYLWWFREVWIQITWKCSTTARHFKTCIHHLTLCTHTHRVI